MLKHRYLRQIKLLGDRNQSIISKLTVGIIGVGGLGSNSALLCAQLGVKKLILMDRDMVSPTDFNRQQFLEKDVGKPKVDAIREKINLMNSGVEVLTYFDQFSNSTSKHFKTCDIILDGTDNYSTRVLINRFCLKNKIPWIFASALRFESQLSTIIPRKTACFGCFAKKPNNELSCEDAGIMNTAVYAIAAIQVQELVNYFCFNSPNYSNALLRMDLKSGLFDKMQLKKMDNCQECKK